MEELVVITFTDQRKAAVAVTRLKELDQLDEITIYDLALIHKQGNNHVEVLLHDTPEQGVKTAEGAGIGALIGVIGGPIWMLLGLLTGAGLASAAAEDRSDFDKHFVKKVNHRLTAGTYAILADVEEDNHFIITTHMEKMDGTAVYTNLDAEMDSFEKEQWDELDQKITHKKDELNTAAGLKKTALEQEIVQLKEKQREEHLAFNERMEARKTHFHNKLALLEEKISAAHERNKERLIAQRAKLKAHFSNFIQKVEAAFK
jgi:uncharacterized membrane protein